MGFITGFMPTLSFSKTCLYQAGIVIVNDVKTITGISFYNLNENAFKSV